MRIVGGPTISSPSIRRPQRSNFGLIVRVPERHQSPWRKSELGICPEDRALLVAKKQEMIGRHVFLKPPPDLTPFLPGRKCVFLPDRVRRSSGHERRTRWVGANKATSSESWPRGRWFPPER